LEKGVFMPEVEEKVYRLEAVLEEFIKSVGIEFNKLYNAQMRTEIELQELRKMIEQTNKAFVERLEIEKERLEEERKAFEERLEKDRERSAEEMRVFKERLEEERKAFEERLEKDRERSAEEMRVFKERLEEERKAFEERLEKDRERSAEEMRVFKERLEEERKAFEERLEKEKRDFKERLDEEKRAFEEKLEKDRKKWEEEFKAWRAEMNKKWGEVTIKLGTFAEDMVAPNIKGIAKQYFGCEEFDFFAVRIKKRHSTDKSKRREFDCIAVCDNIVILNETKAKPKVEYIDDFIKVLEEFYEYFPEYRGKKLIPVFASLYLPDDLVRYLTRNRVYAMAMKEDTMDLLNYEELNTPTP
jgi:DNA repair exonuclease SbcCD ATPase subunit